MTETPSRRCGALGLPDGSVRWRVWAPRAREVELVLLDVGRRRTVTMAAEEGGYFTHTEPRVADGQRYAYRLDGGEDRPDPCSLWQPDGVPGPSAVFHPERFEWTDADWRGVSREDLVFYELHVGTFTPEGTFDAIVPRLPALRELGVTAIELMPVGQFPGSRNWGYDGVLPYAAQNSYGGPLGLQRLVDACHAEGLAVVLDVVYNHLGPEGNYLHEFGPYFTDHYRTPWGPAVNFDDRGSDAVRDYVLDNARTWLTDFHLDGLRLDAVHAMYDISARPMLRAIGQVADDIRRRTGRAIHVVAESDLNDPRIVLPPERGGYGLDAVWSDDFHHAAHAFLTGERRGYYQDFGEARQLAAAFHKPFLYAGTFSPARGRKHGAPADDLPGDRFIACIQNHDQVGNRAAGDRLGTLLASPAKQRLAASLLLFSPYLPLLFMGEEYGEARPFPFFCSFSGRELIEAVRAGRKREFADFIGAASVVPLPDAAETFESAKLSWSWPEGTVHAGMRRLYADLLAARRRWPALRDLSRRAARLLPLDASAGTLLELIRGGISPEPGKTLGVYFNLAGHPQSLPEGVARGQSLLFCSESSRYYGERRELTHVRELLPFECVAMGPAGWGKLH